jgi:hypothetical protein
MTPIPQGISFRLSPAKEPNMAAYRVALLSKAEGLKVTIEATGWFRTSDLFFRR